MKLFKKHHTPDDAPGGSTTEELNNPAGEQGVDGIQTSETTNELPTESNLPSPEKAFAEAKGIDEIDFDDDYSLEKLNEEGLAGIVKDKADSTEKKEVKAPKTEKKPVDEMAFDIEETDETTTQVSEEQESNWNMVAESLNLGVLPEDTFDDFKASIENKIQAERALAIEEGKKLELEKLPDEARKLFDYLSVEGNTVESFMKPLAIFDKYIALDDRSIVEEDYKAKGHEPEDIQRMVDDLELDQKLDLKAKEIRLGLKGLRQQKEDYLIQEARESVKNKVDSINNKRLEENKQFKGQLDNVKDFLGTPVTDRAKSAILKKFEDGVYRAKLASDPNTAVEVAMFLEFKDKLLSLIGRDLVDTGRAQILKKLHNVGLPSGGKSNIPADGNAHPFDVWEQRMKEESAARG